MATEDVEGNALRLAVSELRPLARYSYTTIGSFLSVWRLFQLMSFRRQHILPFRRIRVSQVLDGSNMTNPRLLHNPMVRETLNRVDVLP